MVLLRTFCPLIFLFTTLVWSASMRLSSFPLAVKTPYLSVWMPGHLSDNFPDATPQFWQGQSLTWTILARIDDTTYCLMGCPGGRPGTVQAKQQYLNFTSTHTYVGFEAGSSNLTLDFFSPVDPIDHVRQSLPYSYVTVSARTEGEYKPNIDVLTAIDASWLSTRGAAYAEYSVANGSKILKLNGEQSVDFAEHNEMALWGDVVLATRQSSTSPMSSCQVGEPASVFSSFASSGVLTTSIKTMAEENIAACVQSATYDDEETVATFAVGLQQDDEIQYYDGTKIEKQAGYFRSKVSSVEEAVEYFFDDFEAASVQSHELDKKIREMGEVTSSNYSDLLQFSTRQSFGGQQVVIPSDTLDTSMPYSFIKEISTDGNVNTLADLIPKALPIFHVLNPEYTRMFLEPVLRFSVKGWPLRHAVHDIGKSYPNATGESPCIEEFLPLDSTTVLLWMIYLYQSTTGNNEMTVNYAEILQRYADYSINYGLYPVLQRSSVDAIGSAVNQSALSISAAIALNAYGKMTGQSNYSDLGIEYANSILDIGRDSNRSHFLIHYADDDESFVLTYPLAFDVLMGLNTFPDWVHDMQSAWYRNNSLPFGIRFSNQVPYTLMEFETWAASTSSDDVIHHVVDSMHRFYNTETDAIHSVPGPSQWRVLPGKNEGVWTRFSKAKSVIGSVFMIAAVQQSKLNSSHIRTHVPVKPTVAAYDIPTSQEVENSHPDLALHAELKRDLDPSIADIPYTVPNGASKPVDSSFLGLSIDTASFPAYMGNVSSPNNLTKDLISNILKISGSPLHIRVGGPAGDHSVYDPDQAMAIEQQGEETEKTHVSVGPSFFEGIRVLEGESDIYWSYQVPFAGANFTNALEGTKKAMEAIPPARVSSIEIGHRPNLYAGVHRPENYGCQLYAAEFFKLQIKLRRNIGRVARQFQALGLSSHSIDSAWTMEECFTAGINTQQTLRSVSVHYSQLNSTTDFSPSRVPRHSAVRDAHSKILPEVSYVRDVFSCFPFIISEASLTSPTTHDHHMTTKRLDDQSSLDVALWNLDFLLYSMSQNVSRVHMHQSCDSLSSAWTPSACSNASNSTDQINAPYSALTYVASFLNGVKDFRVIPIQESDDTVVYAGYESGKLSRIAIVSLPGGEEQGASIGTRKPIELKLPENVAGFHVAARLDSISTRSKDGVTAQEDWSADNLPQVPLGWEAQTRVVVKNEWLSSTIDSGEAVLLVLHY